jgi:oligoendopeptidase F
MASINELLNLVGEYKEVYDMLTDPDVDEQTVNDTLEGLMGEIEVHSAGFAAIINRLDMEIDTCKKNKDEWAAAEKVRENRKARLTDLIKYTMTSLGKTEISAGDVSFKLQNAGGQLPLIVDEDVPERFTKITIENDNSLIRKALEDGEQLDFARFGERSKVLKIKK